MHALPLTVSKRSAFLALAIALSASLAMAQDGSWTPFKPSEPARERRSPAGDAEMPPPRARERIPEDRQPQPTPPLPRSGSVERSELAPVMAPDAPGLPLELWRGLDLKTLEGLLAGLDLPPRSPTLHELWRRMLLSSAQPPAGSPSAEHFVALRLEALYRSGLLADMDVVATNGGAGGPVVELLRARRDIGLGQREEGCRAVQRLAAPSSRLPGRLKGEAQLLAGDCAAAANDAQAAALAADLAREESIEAELPLAVLASFATGTKPSLTLPKRVLLLDYRFLELLGPLDPLRIFDNAEPALLVMLAGEAQTDARPRIAAAEAALRLNALSPEAVADVYRRQLLSGAGAADPAAASVDPLLRRALYFQAAELARAPAQRMRFAQAILEDARRSGMLPQM